MSNLKNMRIVCDDISPFGRLKLYDGDGTELPLHGVQDIEITIPVHGVNQARVQMLTEIDVRADVSIERLRLNVDTGKYERIDQDAIRAAVDKLSFAAWNRNPEEIDDAHRELFAVLGLLEDEA